MRVTTLNKRLKLGYFALLALTLAACADQKAADRIDYGRAVQIHREITLEPAVGSSSVSSMGSQAGASTGGSVSAQLLTVSIGSLYMESQLAPPAVPGVTATLQATDSAWSGFNGYVAYSAYDTGGVVTKAGALEHVKTVVCDDLATLLHVEYCLTSADIYAFPTEDIFTAHTDGTNVYAGGSTSIETNLPSFAKLFKLGLNATTGAIGSLLSSKTLPSYAVTGITTTGSSVLATYGTSATLAQQGGLAVMNASDLSTTASQTLYDARSLSIAPNDATTVYVNRGIDATNGASTGGAIVKYNSNGSGSALQTLTNTGNKVAESKSQVIAGKQLLFESLGAQGFRILCKATGAVLLTQGGVTVPGIASTRTVTNSIAPAPGYIFAANGEAGVYVYTLKRNNIFDSNLCTTGLTLSPVGRFRLDADNSDATYTASELSANGIKYVPLVDLLNLNVLAAKLILVSSGNKGVSLINISALTVSTNDVDDL